MYYLILILQFTDLGFWIILPKYVDCRVKICSKIIQNVNYIISQQISLRNGIEILNGSNLYEMQKYQITKIDPFVKSYNKYTSFTDLNV